LEKLAWDLSIAIMFLYSTCIFAHKEVICMDRKVRGGLYLIGGLVAGWMGWQAKDWTDVILSVLFLVSAWHHLMDKK